MLSSKRQPRSPSPANIFNASIKVASEVSLYRCTYTRNIMWISSSVYAEHLLISKTTLTRISSRSTYNLSPLFTIRYGRFTRFCRVCVNPKAHALHLFLLGKSQRLFHPLFELIRRLLHLPCFHFLVLKLGRRKLTYARHDGNDCP